jgi:hypothetical protein
MIDWWGVVHNLLWISGLAGGLAALSMASYQARTRGIRLRQELNGTGFQVPFSVSMVLFCLGLLFSGRSWWEQAIWGLLAVLFVGQAIWLWCRQRREVKAAGPELPPTPPEATPQRSRSSRWLGWGLVLAGLLVLGAWMVFTGLRVLDHARSLQAHLQSLEELVQGDVGGLGVDELGAAGQHLAGMNQDLAAIHDQVGPLLPAGRLLAWVPRYGGDLAAASDLLDMAVAVSAAGDRTFQALAPALDVVAGAEDTAGSAASSSPAGGSSPGLGERLLPVFVAAQPQLETARQELAAAQQARDQVDSQRLSTRVAGLLARLDRYLPWFETALDGALLAPGLLGANGPRTYLLLAQNNYELRATGGFVSGVGEVAIEGGQLTSLTFSDSYLVDNFDVPHNTPPLDFQRTLLGQLWFFRDANWDADYPTSARRALDIYARDRGVQADGAIALDLTALRLLVAAVQPLQVEGIAEPVTGKNVLQIVQQQWDQSYASKETVGSKWVLHRKDFMGQIANAAMDKVMLGQDVQPVRVALALKQALDEKHILVYLADPAAADLLRQRDWDGALADALAPSDLLLVVDSNVGFDKMDASVVRSIHYRVDLAAGEGPRAQVTISYQNQATRPVGACVQESRLGDSYADMMQRCYYDYVRVYVPAGSELLAGPNLPLPPGSLLAQTGASMPTPPISPTQSLDNRAVWTAFFELEPLAEQTLTFEYQLPVWLLDYEPGGLTNYHLQVQKQPGTEAVPIELEVILPAGTEVVRTVPADLPAVQGGALTFDTDLRTDRSFEIVFRRGEGEP